MNFQTKIQLVTVLFIGLFAAYGCAEEGSSGDEHSDCGEYGSEHDGHCHCDDGYLFDGKTCILATDITDVCTDEEHHEAACVCPDDGACPCEGEIESIGGNDYCIPEIHHE